MHQCFWPAPKFGLCVYVIEALTGKNEEKFGMELVSNPQRKDYMADTYPLSYERISLCLC